MYLFAGKRRQADVGSCLNKMHSDGRIALRLIEFDIERSETHDLRSNDLWDQITARLRKGRWFFDCLPSLQHFFTRSLPVAFASGATTPEESYMA